MSEVRPALAAAFARQAIETSRPWASKPPADWDVLDVGSGYGHTALELGTVCRSVVGIEPAAALYATAVDAAEGVANVSFRRCGVEELDDEAAFDLVVLDNVYEHLPNQADALVRISSALRPGGVLYLLTPNRVWPLEAHYRLPFLAWLSLPWANRYLRLTGRGTDYTDASYAPTYWSLRRELQRRPEFDWRFTLPGLPAGAMAGSPAHYRVGMGLLRRWPALWSISKALLVVAVRR